MTGSLATPLHYAATAGNIDAATILLAGGADINAKDDAGYTPLDCVRHRTLQQHADLNGEEIAEVIADMGKMDKFLCEKGAQSGGVIEFLEELASLQGVTVKFV